MSVSSVQIWHNYSFDRQIMHNHGIDCQGLGADTMHMARLVDTARATKGGYSLAALTEHYLDVPKVTMKSRFGAPKLKADGTEGKTIEVPTVAELHHDPQYRPEWIEYSVADAVLTFDLYEVHGVHSV
jgi:DNA polymerase-1